MAPTHERKESRSDVTSLVYLVDEVHLVYLVCPVSPAGFARAIS